MFDFLISSVILFSIFQVAATAAVSSQKSNIEQPFHGNVSCSSVCPPQKSGDNDVALCQDNCPDNWISAIFADTLVFVKWASDCTGQNVTNVSSKSVFLCLKNVKFTNATENVKTLWNRNCSSYLVCIRGENIVTQEHILNVNTTTSFAGHSKTLPGSHRFRTSIPSSHLTAISSSEQPSQLSRLPFLIVLIVGVLGILCIAVVISLNALRRWNLCQPKKISEPPHACVLQQFSDQDVPATSTGDNASEPGSHFPIEETVDNWISNDVHALSTIAKETYSSPEDNGSISLHSDDVAEAQLTEVERPTSYGPRAVTPDRC